MGHFGFVVFLALVIRGHAEDLTDAEKKQLLDKHNAARKAVQPVPANMYEMVWDDDLAADAAYWANECKFYHGNPTAPAFKTGSTGQNIGYTTQSTATKFSPYNEWLGELDYYDYGSNECYWPPCGHVTQLLWDNHQKIGCAYKLCSTMKSSSGATLDSNAKYLVCNYWPPGNTGRQPWSAGAPCAYCPFCHDKLCVANADCTVNGGKIPCTCNRKCHHCGTLTADCKCNCPAGTVGDSCEFLCRNRKVECSSYQKSSCADGTSVGKVIDDYCDVTCEKCQQATDTSWTCGAETYENLFVKYASTPQYGYKTMDSKTCVFPFIYNGKYYHECIPYKDSDWCSVTADYDKYRTYASGCRKIPTTTGGTCKFPFLHNKKYHMKCVKDANDKDICYDTNGTLAFCDLSGVPS